MVRPSLVRHVMIAVNVKVPPMEEVMVDAYLGRYEIKRRKKRVDC